MPVYPVRPRLPVAYSTEIGRIITRWARFEWELKKIAYTILEIGPKEGRLAVRDARAHDYLIMIEDLMRVRGLTTSLDMKHIRTVVRQLDQFRNVLAHGIWINHSTTKTPTVQLVAGDLHKSSGGPQTKAKIDPKAMVVELQAMKTTTADIEKLAMAAVTLHSEIAAQLAASPDKHPQQAPKPRRRSR